VKWSDPNATVEHKLEYLHSEIIRTKRYLRSETIRSKWSIPSPNPLEETATDRLVREREAKRWDEQLVEAHKRIKVLEDWKEEIDERINRITAWVNDALRERKA